MPTYKLVQKLALAAITSALFTSATHVKADVEEDGRLWLNQTMQGGISGKYGWYLEIQERFRDESRDLDQILVRPAIKYKLSDNSSLWFGYGYVSTHPEIGNTTHESRLWQQYSHQFDSWHGLLVSSRTRLEQRWLDSSDDMGQRLRQNFRITYPISSINASLIFWDEYFLNLNNTDWKARRGFDQNRAFVGLGFTLTKETKFEVGYLNQYINTKTNDKSNHILSTVLMVDF